MRPFGCKSKAWFIPNREELYETVTLLKIAREYRILLSGLIALVMLYLSRPVLGAILMGLPIVLLGEMIRTWSSGHIKKNKELATDGPYAYTRNPLYLGSSLIGLGFVVMFNSLWDFLIFAFAFSAIYWGVIRSEEEDLTRTFGDDFTRYVQNVPRFIPRFRREPYQWGGFDWPLVWKHREFQAWLGIAGGVAVLIVKTVLQD